MLTPKQLFFLLFSLFAIVVIFIIVVLFFEEGDDVIKNFERTILALGIGGALITGYCFYRIWYHGNLYADTSISPETTADVDLAGADVRQTINAVSARIGGSGALPDDQMSDPRSMPDAAHRTQEQTTSWAASTSDASWVARSTDDQRPSADADDIR